MSASRIKQVMELYPRIFLACHTRHVRDKRTGQELSDHQASILDHLDEVEGTSLATLARHMGVTDSTMSIAVDRLVRGRYVSRERASQDGRRVSLRLTQDGVRIRREKTVLDRKMVGQMLNYLSVPEQQQAVAGLELLVQAATKLMHSRSSRSLVKRRPARAI